MKKFNCLLFIDHDDLANSFHREMLIESNLVEDLIFFTDPMKGLEYLENVETKGLTKPDVIFFDIDSSRNLGWEMVKFYRGMIGTWHTHLIILSLFLNPMDLKITMESDFIHGFHYKPLSREFLEELFNRYV